MPRAMDARERGDNWLAEFQVETGVVHASPGSDYGPQAPMSGLGIIAGGHSVGQGREIQFLDPEPGMVKKTQQTSSSVTGLLGDF